MTIVLHSEPATTEDVAKILGVPKSRVKWLKRLVDARHALPAKPGHGNSPRTGRRPRPQREEKTFVTKEKESRTEVFLNVPYDPQFDKLFLAYIAGLSAYRLVPERRSR